MAAEVGHARLRWRIVSQLGRFRRSYGGRSGTSGAAAPRVCGGRTTRAPQERRTLCGITPCALGKGCGTPTIEGVSLSPPRCRGPPMTDTVVRSEKPSRSKRTPAGGAPAAPATPEEASDARIDVDRVNDLLLGTWAETRREAREMLKDPAFHRVDGLGMEEHRERVLTPAAPARRARRRAPRLPRGVRRRGQQRRQHRRLRRARRRRPQPADQVGRAVGPLRVGRAAAGHEGAPRQVAPRHHEHGDPRRVRDDRDGPRLGCRGDRHDGHVRPGDRGVRHPHALPRRVEGLPRQRGRCTASPRPCSRS